MKLHTDTLTYADVLHALNRAIESGNVARDVYFDNLESQGSRTHAYGFKFHLAAESRYSGPSASRRFCNTGKRGAGWEYEQLFAATYDEWGWFLAEIFTADPNALVTGANRYDGLVGFNTATENGYVLTVDAA